MEKSKVLVEKTDLLVVFFVVSVVSLRDVLRGRDCR